METKGEISPVCYMYSFFTKIVKLISINKEYGFMFNMHFKIHCYISSLKTQNYQYSELLQYLENGQYHHYLEDTY